MSNIEEILGVSLNGVQLNWSH